MDLPSNPVTGTVGDDENGNSGIYCRHLGMIQDNACPVET